MLDFGFSEILLTSAIALVVLGPEKLPKVARQVGNWMGRARLMARQLSEQLEREVNAEELLKQPPRSPAPPPAALAPPPPAASASASAAETPLTAASDAAAAPIPPEAVVPPPARRAPHPNSPEVMHAKPPAGLDPTTTPTPTTPTPQQSSQ
jgi:sec-independent protein translocase protein TatB